MHNCESDQLLYAIFFFFYSVILATIWNLYTETPIIVHALVSIRTNHQGFAIFCSTIRSGKYGRWAALSGNRLLATDGKSKRGYPCSVLLWKGITELSVLPF